MNPEASHAEPQPSAAAFPGIFLPVGAYLLYGVGLLLGEKISPIQVLGGAILITGVTISVRFGLRK